MKNPLFKIQIIFFAQNSANEKTVELLIDAGADVNAPSKSGFTPLMRSAYISEFYYITIISLILLKFMFVFLNSGKNYKVAEVLLENKAKVNVADKHGWTPLHYSVFKGNMIYILRLLHQTHHFFSLTGFENHVSLLLKFDANQHKKNEKGNTAVVIAEQRIEEENNSQSRRRILEMLLKC